MNAAAPFRFHPPRVELSEELHWVLSRAFASAESPAPKVEEPDQVVRWASSLGLAERIASRISLDRIEVELSKPAARFLENRRAAAAARWLLLSELLDTVLAAAHRLGVRPIALKGAALIESGVVAPESRPLLDLDLLVDPEGAKDLARALVERGLRYTGSGESHHLPPIADPKLGEVEIHTRIPGLRLGNGALTASSAIDVGLLRKSDRRPGLLLPGPELMAAHAAAHGVDQHGFNPVAYPITRVVADLVDLGKAATIELVSGISGHLENAVGGRELAALTELGRTLESGELPSAADDSRATGDASALLHHTIAAVQSAPYRRRLRARSALRAFRRGRWHKFASGLGGLVDSLRR